MAFVKSRRKKLKVHGDYPSCVYRAFDKKEYAEKFINEGRFVLGNLKKYKNMEDSLRKDKTEGEAVFRHPGIVTKVFFSKTSDESYAVENPGYVETHYELDNPKFVLCTSLPGVDLAHMAEKFGKYIVEIDNPRQLATDITSYLETLPHKFVGGIEGCYVKYNKEHIFNNEIEGVKAVTLSYSQKPDSFKKDCEFRFVAIVKGIPSKGYEYNEERLEINLNKKLTYAKLIEYENI